MKKILMIAAVLCAAFVSCQELQYPELSSDTSLTALKCFVPYTDTNGNKLTQEVDLLSGKTNMERGIISYTFPEGVIYTAENVSQCCLEATIPSTAVLELTDPFGEGTGHGLSGTFDLCGQTLYFKITAADGSYKPYQLTCKLSN